MRLIYKNYLYEAIAKGQDLYLEPGTTLFHGTGEEIEGGLGTGGYDSILWTSKSSSIAQSYIPVSGITSRMDSQAFTKPSERLAPFQKQIGIVFDADYDAYGKATSFATIAPQIFKDADDSKRQALRHLMDVEKSTKAIKEHMQAKYKNSGFVFTPEQEAELDADVKKEDQALADLKAAEEAYKNANAQLIKNQYVNQKLKELGYDPLEKERDENYQWKLKESENQILPGDYRRKGQLFIIKPKRKMKLYDMAMNNEPDLTERQYHELDTFEWAKENGYDGVKINDFAQTEMYGNMGHTSYGFFKHAIKDLDITSINDVVHPKEMNGPHSDEYKKHAGINEAVGPKNFGYKIVNYDGKQAYSIADKNVKYPLKKNSTMTGNIYLGTSERYAIDYYSTGSDDPDDPQELLMTYEYDLSDLVKGDPNEKDQMTGGTEIIVKRAKLIAVKNLTADKHLFEEVKHMPKNTQKIMYNGYIFEAMKVNDSIEEYAKKVINKIQNKDYSVYEGYIKPSDTPSKPLSKFNNKIYKIKTMMDTDSPSTWAEYRTRYPKNNDDNIIERVISLYFNKNRVDIGTIYFQLIHELLHAIDPKSIDSRIMKSLPKYVDGVDDIAGYMQQPQEREVLISSAAHRLIRSLTSSIIDNAKAMGIATTKDVAEYLKVYLRSGEILKYANGFIKDEKNIKEFLRLCHFYVEKELENINARI